MAINLQFIASSCLYRFIGWRIALLLLFIISKSIISFGQVEDPYPILTKTPNRLTTEAYGGPFIEEQPPILSRFVRRIFQDSYGGFWFGTNGDGIIHYDGKKLTTYSVNEGFAGVAVRTMLEDHNGHIWFGTENGISIFNPNLGSSSQRFIFFNLSESDGLRNNDIWSMHEDRNGLMWIGTREGLCTYDGKSFQNITIPSGKADPTRVVTSDLIIHSITADKEGNIWLATNGGAYYFNPDLAENKNEPEITIINQKDGLTNDNVNCILEDRAGFIWIATTHGGICRYNPSGEGKGKMLALTIPTQDKQLDELEVWSIFEDHEGHIWFPVKNLGVCRYDGQSVRVFNDTDGLGSSGIQCIYQDRQERLWLGGYLGLFRYDPTQELMPNRALFFSVTR